ncbi:hypothetical protein SDC9_158220 [bioreactor metagenome]|uniref:Uncharacterized protein n=1 Tax=bioreactor metagenome TaxID=1076179 RepID=A0A645FEW8_9ZZZZ
MGIPLPLIPHSEVYHEGPVDVNGPFAVHQENPLLLILRDLLAVLQGAYIVNGVSDVLHLRGLYEFVGQFHLIKEYLHLSRILALPDSLLADLQECHLSDVPHDAHQLGRPLSRLQGLGILAEHVLVVLAAYESAVGREKLPHMLHSDYIERKAQGQEFQEVPYAVQVLHAQ